MVSEHQIKMCGAKTRYLTKDLADKAVRDIYKKRGHALYNYQCPYCNHYHLASGRNRDPLADFR